MLGKQFYIEMMCLGATGTPNVLCSDTVLNNDDWPSFEGKTQTSKYLVTPICTGIKIGEHCTNTTNIEAESTILGCESISESNGTIYSCNSSCLPKALGQSQPLATGLIEALSLGLD